MKEVYIDRLSRFGDGASGESGNDATLCQVTRIDIADLNISITRPIETGTLQ